MREIKFRAWDKERKRMIGVDYPNNWGIEQDAYWGDVFEIALSEITEIAQHHRFEVMQFTGLKDKAGKEIYENDIVDNVWIDGEIYSKGKVIFESGCFTIQTKSGQHQYCPCLNEAWQENIEVIGNIYENPELLD